LVSVRVEGLAALRAQIRGLMPYMADNANRVSTASAAAVIRDDAKTKAPVMSEYEPHHAPPGTLRNAIQIKRVQSPQYRAEYIVFVRQGPKYRKVKVRIRAAVGPMQPGQKRVKSVEQNQDAFYWRFIEFGTSHAKATPFMRRALSSASGAALGRVPRQIPRALRSGQAQV
jgi:HK97 gp10 family phage protein